MSIKYTKKQIISILEENINIPGLRIADTTTLKINIGVAKMIIEHLQEAINKDKFKEETLKQLENNYAIACQAEEEN